MCQAVVNLVDNAIKYSNPGGEVLLGLAVRDSRLVITVSDQGVGIPPSDLDRVFERFYRTDKARSRELGGTGLGLAIVKHIARVHNGDIGVDSLLGKGTTFTMTIPQPDGSESVQLYRHFVSRHVLFGLGLSLNVCPAAVLGAPQGCLGTVQPAVASLAFPILSHSE
jgi:hypothetical protein